MSVIEESEELHARLRESVKSAKALNFELLLRDIVEFQARHSRGHARLLKASSHWHDDVRKVPAVPSDAFRLTRVAVHPSELDVATFFTSGTTTKNRGVHAFRTLETYRCVALDMGRLALLGRRSSSTVRCLAPPPEEMQNSSLGFMLDLFHASWDGRDSPWLVRGGEIHLLELERAAENARQRAEPLLLLATAFALVALLERLGARQISAPEGSAVMVTGGFKGKSHDVSPDVLRAGVALGFGLAPERVVFEYGMTELTSQLYEGTLPDGELNGPPGIYLEPAWLRVVPVAAGTLEPVPDGEVGLAKIIDLANVDSAVAVQTQDQVRRVEAGIELLGRAPGALPRGCSLALEALLG